jgi:hypothetical protein
MSSEKKALALFFLFLHFNGLDANPYLSYRALPDRLFFIGSGEGTDTSISGLDMSGCPQILALLQTAIRSLSDSHIPPIFRAGKSMV